MDYHFVALAIGSDITHTITKDYVTAPEIVLLRAIHGETAVSEIRPTGSFDHCLLYTSPSPRDQRGSRMPSSA